MISVDAPSSSSTTFSQAFGGTNYSFELLYNNFSDQLELVGKDASGNQIFRRNLVPSINMLFGYVDSAYSMIYLDDISTDDTVYFEVVS